MTRRYSALMEGGYPYFAAAPEGRVVDYAYPARTGRGMHRFTVENSSTSQPAIHRRGSGCKLLQRLIAECEARRYRQMIAVIGDLRQCRLDRRANTSADSDDLDPYHVGFKLRPRGSTPDDWCARSAKAGIRCRRVDRGCQPGALQRARAIVPLDEGS